MESLDLFDVNDVQLLLLLAGDLFQTQLRPLALPMLSHLRVITDGFVIFVSDLESAQVLITNYVSKPVINLAKKLMNKKLVIVVLAYEITKYFGVRKTNWIKEGPVIWPGLDTGPLCTGFER